MTRVRQRLGMVVVMVVLIAADAERLPGRPVWHRPRIVGDDERRARTLVHGPVVTIFRIGVQRSSSHAWVFETQQPHPTTHHQLGTEGSFRTARRSRWSTTLHAAACSRHYSARTRRSPSSTDRMTERGGSDAFGEALTVDHQRLRYVDHAFWAGWRCRPTSTFRCRREPQVAGDGGHDHCSDT